MATLRPHPAQNRRLWKLQAARVHTRSITAGPHQTRRGGASAQHSSSQAGCLLAKWEEAKF